MSISDWCRTRRHFRVRLCDPDPEGGQRTCVKLGVVVVTPLRSHDFCVWIVRPPSLADSVGGRLQSDTPSLGRVGGATLEAPPDRPLFLFA